MSEAEPSDEEVWERALDIFGNELACWPGIGPDRLVSLAVRDHYIDPPGIPELCRIDYLATITPIIAFLHSSPDGYDRNKWPPCTPAQFAAAMESDLREHFPKFVRVARLHPDDVPKPGEPVH